MDDTDDINYDLECTPYRTECPCPSCATEGQVPQASDCWYWLPDNNIRTTQHS